MNVLSLFDGMSCGQIALERAGIYVDNYFASEVDKYAIKVTQRNYSKTIQLGDVGSVNACDLPKVDLLLGGSPCQGFSRAGKHLNLKDPRSALFFEYVRLLKECKPRYFLFENVKMGEKNVEALSFYLGVDPIEIDSALVSAQRRKRLYWTNIPVKQPDDAGVFLKDIFVSGYVDRDKSYCVSAAYMNAGSLKDYIAKCRRQLVSTKEIYVYEKPHGYNKGGSKLRDKFNCLREATSYNYAVCDNTTWRKLLPVECERLQTVPDDYTSGVSNTQRYKMLGNGWTIDVIVHILKGIKTFE